MSAYNKGEFMNSFQNKTLVLLGERDGIPGPVLEQLFAGSAATIAYAATECFV